MLLFAMEEMFWTGETKIMAFALCVALVLMIVLPFAFKIVDHLISYFFLAMGLGMLALAQRLGMVTFKDGGFVQHLMHGHIEGLHVILLDPWMLALCFAVLSLLAYLLRHQIERGIRGWSRRMAPENMIFLWTLVIGFGGSISVVVMATLGGTFFKVLQQVADRRYTGSVVAYSANIGISALLTTIGEPLSLFMAKNLKEDTVYLVRTFGLVAVVNTIVLAFVARWLATHATRMQEDVEQRMLREVREAEVEVAAVGAGEQVRQALEAVEEFEEEEHDFAHVAEGILHQTTKLIFFVWGLLFFGEAVKPIAAHIVTAVPVLMMFFVNAISSVADNALLGLLEVQYGMAQGTVLILGISLAFWGAALVPGNVCNIVLKESLDISFKDWARYGVPIALLLAVVNGVLVLTPLARLLML